MVDSSQERKLTWRKGRKKKHIRYFFQLCSFVVVFTSLFLFSSLSYRLFFLLICVQWLMNIHIGFGRLVIFELMENAVRCDGSLHSTTMHFPLLAQLYCSLHDRRSRVAVEFRPAYCGIQGHRHRHRRNVKNAWRGGMEWNSRRKLLTIRNNYDNKQINCVKRFHAAKFDLLERNSLEEGISASFSMEKRRVLCSA